MSEVPTEYKVFKKKFYKSLQKALGDDLLAVIVYGSCATDRIYAGVSDVDFFILLKKVDELSRPLSELYQEFNTVISEFISNPLFAAILDYDIYTEDMIPKGKNLNGFSAIRAVSLKTGETLAGKNPFEKMTISKEDLKNSAKLMVHEYLTKLTNSSIITEFDDEETQESYKIEMEFNAVDAVLSSAQAYQILMNGEYKTMPDIVYDAEINPTEGWDNELVVDVGLLRQGVEKEVDDLYNRSINFVGNIIKLME
ncbi:MAG: nucleotidyltransferase domain-containing protein [Candidatus Heimdallarchaeota archaeon]|nr:nucleotidyltransferase domain-containing protein [Candidatus Heimdallarchaeota archaeon]